MEMNFVMSSDNNYAQHLLIASKSLFESQSEENIVILHVLSNDIENDTIEKLKNISRKSKNTIIKFYDISNVESKIGRTVNTEISITAYVRLFITDLLDTSISKIVYLDVDVLVLRDLSELFTLDIKEKIIAGVKSTVDVNKNPKHNSEIEFHINSGVILFDLDKCRDLNIVNEYMKIIDLHDGLLEFHDQTVINETFKGKIYPLGLEYNFTSPFLALSYKRIIKLYNLIEFYNEESYNDAKSSPKIIHATAWAYGRPWSENNRHPYRNIYKQHLKELDINNMNKSKVSKTKNLMRIFVFKYSPIFLINILKKN